MKSKFLIGFTVCLFLASSFIGVAESLTWSPVTDASSYRVFYGIVGGATNQVNATTNLQTWTNPVSGTNYTAPGTTNLNLTLDQRHFLYVVHIISKPGVSVVGNPSSVLFYTPRSGPSNVSILDP